MNLYVVVLALITLTLLGVSLGRLGRVKTKADYLVAGRSLSAFVLVFTLLSSWIGSGSLLAGAENAYRHGFAALWQAAGGWAGLLLIYFIAPRARRFAQYTIPDLLEARYSQAARVLGVLAILLAYTAVTSYQFIGGGDILHLIFPTTVTPILGRYMIAGFVVLLTAIAGMSSVAYMDLFIGLLATFSLCLALPVLVHLTGGWGAVHLALPATHFEVFGDLRPVQALELFLPTCLLLLGNQSMYQKFFSAKTERDASRAVVGWIVGTVILESVIVALAVTGSARFPAGEVSHYPREILAYVGLHAFEPAMTTVVVGPQGAVLTGTAPAVSTAQATFLPLLGALLIGAIFAKVISTANNWLFSPATNLVNDIYVRYIDPEASNRRVLLVSRVTVVLLGAWALYQGLYAQSVLKMALYAYTIYGSALTPVILAAFYWRRATAAAAVASIATGTLMTVLWERLAPHLPRAVGQRDAILPALLASLFCLLVVSLLTRRPDLARLESMGEA